MMTTDPAILPQWNGRPVPWVTRWSGEVIEESLTISLHPERREIMVGYRNGNENREPSGILWQREGITRGGEPQWAQVSTYRQRASMTRRKCQVCGRKIESRVIRWLIPKRLLETTEDGETLTTSPPTCDSCIPLALELCPFLKKSGEWVILRVLEYEAWGVLGEAVAYDKEKHATQRLRGAMIKYDKEYPRISPGAVIAKQQVAQLTKFSEEKS